MSSKEEPIYHSEKKPPAYRPPAARKPSKEYHPKEKSHYAEGSRRAQYEKNYSENKKFKEQQSPSRKSSASLKRKPDDVIDLTSDPKKLKTEKKTKKKKEKHNVLVITEKSLPLLQFIKDSYEQQLHGLKTLKEEVLTKLNAMETHLANSYTIIVNEVNCQQIALSMKINEKKRLKKKRSLQLKKNRHQKQRLKRKLKRLETHQIKMTIGESPF